MYKFRCKTPSGYIFKSLADLLQINVTKTCLRISASGIKMRTVDTSMKLLLDLDLKADNFSVFEFSGQPIEVGLNTSHLFKIVKNIRKKDSIEFRIRESSTDMLEILVIPKEGNRVSSAQIKVLNWQSLDIEIPEGYERPVIVATSEMQKLVKDLSLISDKIVITSTGGLLTFSSTVDKIYNKTIQFGEATTSASEDIISDEFENHQLSSITKISGLARNVSIYMLDKQPVYIKIYLDTLGTLGVYLRGMRCN